MFLNSYKIRIITFFICFMGCVFTASGQEKNITIKIIDEKSNPVPYAAVELNSNNTDFSIAGFTEENGQIVLKYPNKGLYNIKISAFSYVIIEQGIDHF